MGLMHIYKAAMNVVTASMLSGTMLCAAQAEDNKPEENDISVNGIVRVDMAVSDQGIAQRLPNLVMHASSDDWKLSGAIKVDNLEASKYFSGDHDARLLFLNATYKGLEDQGTTLKFGLLSPMDLTQNPLVKGFMPVSMNYALSGGIVGAKIDQRVFQNENTQLNINGGAGIKPEWVERFGKSADLVTFAGFDLKHKFSDILTSAVGYEYMGFSDNENPSGVDHYIYAKFAVDTDLATYELYGEKLVGERSTESFSKDMGRYSVMASGFVALSSQIDFRVAAGLQDDEPIIETGLYRKFKNGFRGTIGAGHNFETDDNTVQLGLIKQL